MYTYNLTLNVDSVKLLNASRNVHSLIDKLKNKDFTERSIILLMSLILIIGLIGNSLNILIFSKKTVRSNSTFRFLLYLSIFDLLVLLVCTPDVFLRFGYQIHIRQISIYTCRLHTFLTYLFTHASSSTLMLISIDRALIISNRNSMLCYFFHCCSSKIKKISVSFIHRADLIMIFLLAALIIINSHFILLMTITAPGQSTNKNLDQNLSNLLTDNTDNTYRYYIYKLQALQQQRNSMIKVCFPLKGFFFYKSFV